MKHIVTYKMQYTYSGTKQTSPWVGVSSALRIPQLQSTASTIW